VKTLTEVLALETKGTGVNVNCIAPSVINSAENRRSMPKANHSKWVSPEDIAEVVLFLASEESSPTSGALVPVYGNS
jgi:NAD(P)-dependent dehydrogenase (short-subunit alcohol dehydrogenase family)